jgi:acyl-ACP thioesterase
VCYRRIQIVELNGDRLVEKQSNFVSLTDAECNVATIATKVSETLNSGEECVLLDSRNQELMDCPVTQGY